MFLVFVSKIGGLLLIVGFEGWFWCSSLSFVFAVGCFWQ
jgi:hypothetical protein